MSNGTIQVRSWVPGNSDDVRDGLLAYLCVDTGGLVIDGLTVRRTVDGRTVVSYPCRRDRAGRKHPVVRPVSEQVRLEIERVVLQQMRDRMGLDL